MKKEKLVGKKIKKELEDQLTAAFLTITAGYGKIKKSKSIIEKLAKKLTKKIDLKSKVEVDPEKTMEAKEKATPTKRTKKIEKINK